MASEFIGLHMRVVLREPPGFSLTGTVRDVTAGSSLTLTNGWSPTATPSREFVLTRLTLYSICRRNQGMDATHHTRRDKDRGSQRNT